MIVAVEIGFFFLTDLENALFDASTMFVESVVTVGLPFPSVGSSEWTDSIAEIASNTAV